MHIHFIDAVTQINNGKYYMLVVQKWFILLFGNTWPAFKFYRKKKALEIGLRSRKESEVFGRSRIPKITWSQSRIFLFDSGSPIESFYTLHSPK